MGSVIFSVKNDGVSMRLEDDCIYISGSIDCKEPGEFMNPFLKDVHEYIIKNKIKKVDVNIMELNFLNSSGIKEFIYWIMKLEPLPPEEQYTINFICNQEYLWQEPSIKTLLFLYSKLVKIDLK